MAATSDRLGIYIHERPSSIFHEQPIKSGEDLYEGTLAQLNSSGEIQNLTHSDGDDDSNVVPFAVLGYQSEDDPTADPHFDRGSTSPLATVYENVLLELKDNTGNLSNYTETETTVYAVDNETVDPSQADGSAGSRPKVGTVYRKKENAGTVIVHVDGLNE
jgi:hypothetical protein